MEASAGVLRRFPSITGAGARINTSPFHRSSSLSCPCSKSSQLSLSSVGNQELGANLKSGKFMVSGFYDEGYLEYYSSGRGKIKCGKKEKNRENDVALKKTKKKLKLLKGLSRNLNEIGFGFGPDVALVDQVQGKTISEAAELLLGQLQQLKSEEELKRKRKEEKALMKMKRAASTVQGTMNCGMSSSSSSSSSSESSDGECQNVVDMKSLKCESLAKTIPEAGNQAIENATSAIADSESLAKTIPEACNRALENAKSAIANHMIEPPEVDTSVEISSTSSTSNEASTERATSLERKEGRNLEASDCCISSSSTAAVAATTTAAGMKKIEVCMGGKCKKSGAAALLEKFQQVVGIEAAVSGCKCMGKCKVGPNVKVSEFCCSGSDAFQADDSVSVRSTPASTNSLCIGVGLEDVNLIANNLLGRYQEVALTNVAS